MKLEQIQVERKTGHERFVRNGTDLQFDLMSFWQWSCSDLVSNTLRGVLAEYIVAIAIGVESKVRKEWDSYDLELQNGVKIEVKSASYIQSWGQERYSSISFGIQPTSKWNPKTNRAEGIKKRQADVYVFCLLSHQNKMTVDPLKLDQWTFYVLATKTLNKQLGAQKTLSLGHLLKLEPKEVDFSQMRDAIKIVSS